MTHVVLPCAGGVDAGTVSWHDLPTDLVETILSRVPLLRLAQMAHLARDFRAVYLDRMAAHVAQKCWLQGLYMDISPSAVSAALAEELEIRKHPWHQFWDSSLPIWKPCPGNLDTRSHACRVKQFWRTCCTRGFTSPAAPFQISCSAEMYMDGSVRQEFLFVRVHVEARVTVGLLSRHVVCKEVVLTCCSRPFQPPDIAVVCMACTAMAAPLRKFLSDIARGPARDRMRKGRAGPVQSLKLVLLLGSAVLTAAQEAAICDALTCLTARVGCNPSGLTVEVQMGPGNEITTSLSLPCVIGG